MPAFTSLGVALSVFDRGAGVPIVCVHGTFGTGQNWAPFARHVGSEARVIAPDLFGEGMTPRAPAGLSPFDADVALVRDVLTQLGAPAHIVGHSFGATLALAVALESPATVATATLVEPNGLGDASSARDSAGVFAPFRAGMERSRHRLLLGDQDGAARAIVNMAQGSGIWESLGPERRELFARSTAKYSLSWVETLARAPCLRDAAGLKMPALLVAGTEGPLAGRWSAARLAEVVPNARFVELATAGHMLHLTHPLALAEAFQSFAGALAAE